MEKKGKILSQEMLKLIACVTMLIDHFGHAIVPQLQIPHMVEFYYACRSIGRIAFPIYCFLLVEGMRRTRDPYRYVLRLFIGALLAELPFDLLFDGYFNWGYQSVMVTLTLGALMLLSMKKVNKQWLKFLLVLPFVVLAEIVKCDYGAGGIAMIAVFALVPRQPTQALALVLVNWLAIPSATLPILGFPVSVQLFAILALIPIGLYSGRKLTYSRAVQWAFYLFYPLHILILWIISGFIG